MLSGSSPRVAQKLIAAVLGLLVVPIAVNVGTGGTLPIWMTPLASWAWPIAGGCVLLIVALEVVEQRSPKDISTRRPSDPRNIELALDQVARYVDLRQQNSLAERVRVTLSLDERPETVHQPVHLVRRTSVNTFDVRDAGGIVQVFEELSGSMLILGAPGAGKSTQLLDLAKSLIDMGRAERQRDAEAKPPLPVVVDLAEWSRSGARRRWLPRRTRPSNPISLSTWLKNALHERYGIPDLVSEYWLADDTLALLLDGLDEVRESDRERCVQEINELHRTVSRLVVCSRTTDYESLRGSLQLQGAVEIRALRRDQVVAFLSAISPQLRGVAEALQGDEDLWELLTTPLMLNIMALAYGDGAPLTASARTDSLTRRKLLFDAYVVEVLARRRARSWRADAERSLYALRALARFSRALDSGVQVVRPTIDNLDRGLDATQKRVTGAWLEVVGCSAAAVGIAAVGAAHTGRVFGLLVGIVGWFIAWGSHDEVSLVAESRRLTGRRRMTLAAWSIIAGASPFVITGAFLEVSNLLLTVRWSRLEWFTAGIASLVASTVWGLLLISSPNRGQDPQTQSVSGARNLIAAELVVAAAGVLAAGWWLARPQSVGFWAFAIAVVGVPAGVVVCAGVLSIVASGRLVRLALVLGGEADPWRTGLLRFSADRSLLSLVNGEYSFVHLLVRDHLADCDPVALAEACSVRRDQLTPTT